MNGHDANQISTITRTAILDEVQLSGLGLYGKRDEVAFLSRIFDLASLPTTDGRFKKTIKILVNNLSSIGTSLAELRTRTEQGTGKKSGTRDLNSTMLDLPLALQRRSASSSFRRI